jgi:hypothetical protein
MRISFIGAELTIRDVIAGATMPGQDSSGDLIAAIYDAVIDPSRWEEIVRRIVVVTKSMNGGVLIQPSTVLEWALDDKLQLSG